MSYAFFFSTLPFFFFPKKVIKKCESFQNLSHVDWSCLFTNSKYIFNTSKTLKKKRFVLNLYIDTQLCFFVKRQSCHQLPECAKAMRIWGKSHFKLNPSQWSYVSWKEMQFNKLAETITVSHIKVICVLTFRTLHVASKSQCLPPRNFPVFVQGWDRLQK